MLIAMRSFVGSASGSKSTNLRAPLGFQSIRKRKSIWASCIAKDESAAVRRSRPSITTFRRGQMALLFRTGSTIAGRTLATSTLAYRTTRTNSPATVSSGTGIALASSVIQKQLRFFRPVMEVAVTLQTSTSSSTTSNASANRSAWRYGSLTIRRTARSTIRLNVDSFRMLVAFAAECSSTRLIASSS